MWRFRQGFCLLLLTLAASAPAARDRSAECSARTLAVNIVGSFIIGLVMALSLERGVLGDEWRILLTTGFCGGFTTMSTFSYETLALLRDGESLLAFWNVTLSFAACVGAAWLGTTVGQLS